MTFDKIASIISLVLNPALVAAVTFLILMWPIPGNQIPLLLLGICVTFGTIIPLMMMQQLSTRGLISDFFISDKEERLKPFAGAIASYIVGSIALLFVKAPIIVTGLMLCYVGNTVVMMLITLRWKISVHASGIAGPATALVYGLGAWAIVFFILLVPVGWARMRLGAHTSWQILAGSLVTIIATGIQLRIYLSIL